MALSQTCIKQHDKEEALTRRWISWGLVFASGCHAALIPLWALRPMPIKQLDDPERIELMVTAPTVPSTQPEAHLEEPTLKSDTSPSKSKKPEQASTEPESLADPKEPDKLAEPEDAEAPDKSEESETSEASEQPEKPDSTPDPTNALSDVTEPVNHAHDGQNNIKPLAASASNAVAESLPTQIVATSGLTLPTSRRDNEQTGTESGESPEGSQPAARQEPTADSTPNQNTSRFGCRNCVRPDYPEIALDDEIEGQPAIEFEVDENGNVISARIAQSSGSAALDQAALAAVRQSTFTTGGQGRAHTMEVNFSIEGSERNRAARRQGERHMVEEQTSVEASNPGSSQPASPLPVTETLSSPGSPPASDSATNSSAGESNDNASPINNDASLAAEPATDSTVETETETMETRSTVPSPLTISPDPIPPEAQQSAPAEAEPNTPPPSASSVPGPAKAPLSGSRSRPQTAPLELIPTSESMPEASSK